VAGASVMPVVVNAPPVAAALMIGDRAGEFVAAAARP
jgi:choline dehydrogenase-like flavoprotein